MARCQRCWLTFSSQQRQQGHCPHCGVAFETAELVALCIGLACSYLLAPVLPELLRALLQSGSWQAPADHTVLLRAALVGGGLVSALLLIATRYPVWQGATLAAHPWLRLLWLLALPGLLYAGLVLGAGVAYLILRQGCSPRRALAVFVTTA